MNIRYCMIVPKIYPLFCLALSLMLGIWWQTNEPYWLISVGLASIISCIILILFRKSIAANPLYIALYASAFFLGCFTYHQAILKQQVFCTYTDGKQFDITGIITEIKPTTNPYIRYAMTLKIVSMTSSADQQNTLYANEHICLYAQSIHNLHVADTILVKTVRFKTPANPEFRQFLLKENILTSATIQNCAIELVNRPYYSWSRMVAEYRNKLLKNFRACMDRETFLAFSSIFLGDPLAKKKEDALKSQLKRWGLFHYIARAGLHLVIFVSIWMFIFGLLPLPWALRQILIILICSLYFFLTWPSIPFNRAFFTLIMVRICGLLRLKTYYIPSLCLIAFITLLENPVALFALDFQLSFGVTFALAWFNEIRTQSR